MRRVLEPEIMGDPKQSRAYANADFASSNQFFVDALLKSCLQPIDEIVDLGCGPGNVMVRLATAAPQIRITAVDASAAMIALATEAVKAAGLEARIFPLQGYVPGLPLPVQSYDAVLSKDFLHHLPDPMALWTEARRLGREGAIIQVMDLIRPQTTEDARAIVEAVTPTAPKVLKDDFYNSLCAAFTMDEVEDQLLTAELSLTVQKVSERHMLITGALL